jgi:2'-5' RNA ligase
MRVFVALDLPKKVRARIHRASAALRKEGLPVRWLEPDKLHITLKFLGEVRTDRIDGIVAVVSRVAAATNHFSITLAGFGAFPTVRKPKVVWLGVRASPELRCLKQDLEWGLADCGFETETRAFHPHLTLGRVEASDGAGAFRGLDELLATLDFQSEVPVRSIEVMRSHLSSEGSRYSVLTTTRLQGA